VEISGDRTVRAASMLLQEKEVSKVMAPSMDSISKYQTIHISKKLKQTAKALESNGELWEPGGLAGFL